MTDDTIVEELTRFGLSEKEVLAYTTILRNGNTKVSTISEEADVSKSYAYDIVKELEDRQLVEINDHQVPTQIHAIPPSEGINHLISQLHSVEDELEELFNTTTQEEQEFSVIKARQTVLNRIRELIMNAESEVVLSIPSSALNSVADSLTEIHEQDIFCMTLISDYEYTNIAFEDIAHVVRTWDIAAPVILTVDREYGIIASPEVVLESNSDKYAIFHREDQIVSTFFDSFIANYWPVASQEHVTERHSLPRTYTSFRHAVFDATLALFDRQPVKAEIEMRPVQTNEPFETVEVTVVDVKQSLVRPVTNQFPTQDTLVVEEDDLQITVGGLRAFLEDFEARQVSLSLAD